MQMDAKVSSWHEFYKNRKIIIKDVPPVTYKDIREYLGLIQASDIVISKRHKHVIITVTHGEHAEQYVGVLATRRLLGKAVNVGLYPRRMMLCILGVPLQLDEAQFRGFADQFGPVEICFLMRGATGMSKGYGLVEFAHNRPTTDRVRAMIAGATFPAADGIIRRPMGCDYLPESVLRYDDLHSLTVTFLDNLGNPGGAMQLATGAGTLDPAAMSRGVMTATGQNHNFVAATYRTIAEAERAWSLMGGVHARGLPVCSFAMPGVDATRAVMSASSSSSAAAAPVTRSTSGSRTTPAEAVKRFCSLFPGKTELAKAFEKFLSKVVESLNGEPLTDQAVETILALVAKPGSENLPAKVSPSGDGQISLRAGTVADKPWSHFSACGGPQLQARVPTHAAVAAPHLTAPLIAPLTASNESAIMPPVSWQPEALGFHQPAVVCSLRELQLPNATDAGPGSEASDLSYPCGFTVPGSDYEALPSLSGPVTRGKRRSGTFGGAPSSTAGGPAAATAAAPVMASPYSRQAIGSDRQHRAHSDRCFVFEASLEEALSYVSSHKQSTLTPRTLRAAARLLPEPEPSPEGHYIGQHSQGIGGHYAESYWMRKRQQHSETSFADASPRLHSSSTQQLHFR